MHTQHTHIQRMIGWNSAHAQDGPGSRNASFFNKGFKFFFGFAQYYTLAKNDKWFFCFIDQFCCFVQYILCVQSAWAGSCGYDRILYSLHNRISAAVHSW